MTALLKNFVDRLAPLKSPKIKAENGNFDLQDSKAKTQKFVIISNCGFPGENNFDVLRAAVACCNPSLEIYRNCGKLLKSKKPEIAKTVDRWLNVVEQAGKEMTIQGKISEITAKDLNMSLMSIPDYIPGPDQRNKYRHGDIPNFLSSCAMTSFRWVCNKRLPEINRAVIPKSMFPIFATHPWERGRLPSGNHRTADCESAP